MIRQLLGKIGELVLRMLSLVKVETLCYLSRKEGNRGKRKQRKRRKDRNEN